MDKLNETTGILLHGDDFFLRPWHSDDAEWYVTARDEAVFKWTTEKRDLSIEQTKAAIKRVNNDPLLHCLAIVDSASMHLLGNIALVRKENDESVAEIMYWLAPQGRGRGVATRAVRLLSDWALGSLKLDRITLKTHIDNVPSQRVAERAGFQMRQDPDSSGRDTRDLWFEIKRAP